jgi:hypothetical protein
MYPIFYALRGRKIFLFLRIEQMRAIQLVLFRYHLCAGLCALPNLERMSEAALWRTFSLDSRTLNKISIASDYRARICKCLWSPGIDSDSGTTTLFVVPDRHATYYIGRWNRILGIDSWS